MIRFTKALAVAAVVLTLPSMASALGIELVSATSSGASTSLLLPGETITFDLRLENLTAQEIFGLDVVVSGYDTPGTTNTNDSHLELAGGSVVSEAFLPVPFPGTGLQNQRSAPTEIWTLNQFNPQPNRVQLFAGVSFGAVVGTGANDTGVDGGLTIPGGDVHFRVVFSADASASDPAAQVINLNFGVDQSIGHVAVGNGGAILPFTNAGYTITVIPEPGTALLMGLGLAGLAANRRR